MKNMAENIMAAEEATYKGKKIVMKSDEEEPKLIIDNKEIDVEIDVEAKKFSSYSLMSYVSFNSLKELAEALIEVKKV